MECNFSSIVNPSRYDTQGLCADIPVRKISFHEAESVGAECAQEDWQALVGPIGDFSGCLDVEFSAVSVTAPEYLPERLDIVAYCHEFAFWYDGMVPSLVCDLNLWC